METKNLGGRYKIIQELGKGGFGQTYLARDQQLPGQPYCVVKHLTPHKKNSDHRTLSVARRLFNTEAEVLYKLGQHSQIPQLFAHFEENREFYLVQEFIPGHSLQEELPPISKPLSASQVQALLQEICSVLNFVHDQNVIHRDLKPANLIRRETDQKIVLIDFGAVKQINIEQFDNDSEQSLTVAVGSLGYMPNEQLGGNPRFSSDIYALGMIAIQALTGLHPREIKPDHVTGELVWQHGLSIEVGLARILDKMVCYDFRQRYQSVKEVLSDLINLSDDSSTIINDNITNNLPGIKEQQSINPKHYSLPTEYLPSSNSSQTKYSDDNPTITTARVTSKKYGKYAKSAKSVKFSPPTTIRQKIPTSLLASVKLEQLPSKLRQNWLVIAVMFTLLISSWQMYRTWQMESLIVSGNKMNSEPLLTNQIFDVPNANSVNNTSPPASNTVSPSPTINLPNDNPDNGETDNGETVVKILPLPIASMEAEKVPDNSNPKKSEANLEKTINSSPSPVITVNPTNVTTPPTNNINQPSPVIPNIQNSDINTLLENFDQNKSKAIAILIMINQNQQIYFLENGKFARSLPELKITEQSLSDNYDYQITTADQQKMVVIAKAKQSDLPHYVSAIAIKNDRNVNKICVSQNNPNSPANPTFQANSIQCPNGFTAIN